MRMMNEAEVQAKTRKKETEEMKGRKQKNGREMLAAEREGVKTKKGVGGLKAVHPVRQKGQQGG